METKTIPRNCIPRALEKLPQEIRKQKASAILDVLKQVKQTENVEKFLRNIPFDKILENTGMRLDFTRARLLPLSFFQNDYSSLKGLRWHFSDGQLTFGLPDIPSPRPPKDAEQARMEGIINNLMAIYELLNSLAAH